MGLEPAAIALTLIVGVLGLGGYLLGALRSARKRLGRKSNLYARLEKLTTDVHIDYFVEKLGMGGHAFKDIADTWTEYIFADEFAYVQVVANGTGRVLFYSVTAHDDDFKPRIWPHKSPSGGYPELPLKNLREASFAEIGADLRLGGVDFFISGASAPSHYLEAYYLGHPGLYRTYLIGLNQSGAGFLEPITDLYSFGETHVSLGHLLTHHDDHDGYLKEYAVDYSDWRAQHRPNVYGVTGQHFSLADPPFPLRLGPNPNHIRLLNE